MKRKVRALLQSSYWGRVCLAFFEDLKMRRAYSMGNIETFSGTAHLGKSVDESLAYIELVFRDYKLYSGVERFHGRIAEVGPGDNCGVALLFLLDGCSHVDLVDRFYSKRDVNNQQTIYKSLLSKYPRLSEIIGRADNQDESAFKGLARRYGADAAAETYFGRHVGFDFIVSRAVFEHLYDPLKALRCMETALNPGGYLLHKVDLRDHGMFSTAYHELKFLEVPDWIYPWITQGSGRPNRILYHQYADCFKALKLDGQVLVTQLAQVGEIDPHLPYEAIPKALRDKSLSFVRSVRKKFARSFRDVSDEDLSVAGIFVVGKKVVR